MVKKIEIITKPESVHMKINIHEHVIFDNAQMTPIGHEDKGLITASLLFCLPTLGPPCLRTSPKDEYYFNKFLLNLGAMSPTLVRGIEGQVNCQKIISERTLFSIRSKVF